MKLLMIVAFAITAKVLYVGATVIVGNYGLIGALITVAMIYCASLILERRGW
jgi:hypothetical protein